MTMTMTMTETTTTAPAPVLDEETRRVLATAKGLVAKGWCQGAAHEGDRFCVMGALSEAVGYETGCPTRFRATYNVLARASGTRLLGDHRMGETGDLAIWNDMPGRTQAEVVALFDRALGA